MIARVLSAFLWVTLCNAVWSDEPPPNGAAPPPAESPASAPPTPPTPEAEPLPAPKPPASKPPASSPKKAHRPHVRTTAQTPQGPPPPAPVAEPGSATAIDAQVGEVGTALTSILGKNVQGPNGEDIGRVVDVLADAHGRVRVAVIDFGGFLGVGTRRIAVDWPLLRFDPNAGEKSLMLSLTREKLQSAPEYKDSSRPRVLMPPKTAPPADAADTGQAKK